MRVLVTGAGGFIGGHLVGALLGPGHEVRAVDCKPLSAWEQRHPRAQNWCLDLRRDGDCRTSCREMDMVYNLAADMGGMGYIATHRVDCMRSVLINTQLVTAAVAAGVGRYFYASSACVYPDYRQDTADAPALREADAYPAMPEDGYGWEKLFSERLCRAMADEHGLETRVARYHNVYGPRGTWRGGREKAPAALCRKVAEAVRYGHAGIDIWGDGQQTRSFLYIDDCVAGTERIMRSRCAEPLNLGSDRLVTIDQLARMIERIAGVELEHRYHTDQPQGVRGRCSDNTRLRAETGWAPTVPLETGLTLTYGWIEDQVWRHGR